MFTKARLHLTAWYLLIIMIISVSFSGIIYKGITLAFQQRFHTVERRIESIPPPFRPTQSQFDFFVEELEESRHEILLILLYTNLGILIFSSLAGYFLAGKTLKPIEKAMDQQKRFIGDASHEMKTPLTSLITSLEVALSDKNMTKKEAKQVLAESLEDATNLKDLANNLLSLTKYQHNGHTFPKEMINAKESVQKALNTLKPLAKKKNIKLTTSLKNVFIFANSESLEKVATILLDNAIKYTPPKGRVKLSLETKGRNMVLEVSDNGIGIEKENEKHIFERFYREDSSRCKQEVAGFGLGLSIAQQIVSMHSGTISVESTPGTGSVFSVIIPLKNS